jgi:hypothetical protein
MFSSSLLAQSNFGIASYSGGHDSLLFDGANKNISNLREECNMKVTMVKGQVWGSILTSKIEETCGEYDTVMQITYGPVKVGDILVSEGFVRTKDFSQVEVELKDGKKVWLGPGTEFKMGRDYCMGSGIANLYTGTVHVQGGTEGNTYVATDRSMVHITKTEFSVETVNDGGIITDIIRMYEGSVTFGPNMKNKEYQSKAEDKGAEMKKLTDDYQSGKITIEEFSVKMSELQKEMTETLPPNPLTVNAGYMSKIVGSEKPTEPVAFDTNENRWWENK